MPSLYLQVPQHLKTGTLLNEKLHSFVGVSFTFVDWMTLLKKANKSWQNTSALWVLMWLTGNSFTLHESISAHASCHYQQVNPQSVSHPNHCDLIRPQSTNKWCKLELGRNLAFCKFRFFTVSTIVTVGIIMTGQESNKTRHTSGWCNTGNPNHKIQNTGSINSTR